MTDKKSPLNNKIGLLLKLGAAGVVLAVLLTLGGFGFAASQETHDPFCASCHTQPESTFLQRSTASQAVDLASFHTAQNTRCIDCHSGPGLVGRVSAELMGARNAFKWYTGTAVQPAVVTFPIGDQNCLKCHQAVTQQGYQSQAQITVPGIRTGGRGEGEGRNNHWHQFLARWQAASSTAGNCLSCHPAHAISSASQTGFMESQAVQATCDACHQVMREREGGG